MLIGEFNNKLEAKNRLALPKKFREILGKNLIATRGYDSCIVVVNIKQWDKLLEIFKDKPFTLSSARDTRRFLIGGASEVILDTQGRFVLPTNLLNFAGIKKEVVFVGLIDWVEIWDAIFWEKKIGLIKPNAEKIAEKLDVLTKHD